MNQKKKSLAPKNETIVNFLPVMEASKAKSSNLSTLQRALIDQAKKVHNVRGALYICSEVMVFNEPSRHYKTVYYDSEGQRFVKTLVEPVPIPVLHNHIDGTSESHTVMADGGKIKGAGRVLTVAADKNDAGQTALFAGQVIFDKETIDRIMSLTDYSQSISIRPKSYFCEECKINALSDECPHMPGDIIDPGTPKERFVYWKLVPDFAVEFSFVFAPAYPTARVLSVEQNSIASRNGNMLCYTPALFSLSAQDVRTEQAAVEPSEEKNAVTIHSASKIWTAKEQQNIAAQNTEDEKCGIINKMSTNAQKQNSGENKAMDTENILSTVVTVMNSISEAVNKALELSKASSEAVNLLTQKVTLLEESVQKNSVTVQPNVVQEEEEVKQKVQKQETNAAPAVETPSQENKVVDEIRDTLKKLVETNIALLESIRNLNTQETAEASAPKQTAPAQGKETEELPQTDVNAAAQEKTDQVTKKTETNSIDLGKHYRAMKTALFGTALL